jgi:ketosteroid isomerase-like protein
VALSRSRYPQYSSRSIMEPVMKVLVRFALAAGMLACAGFTAFAAAGDDRAAVAALDTQYQAAVKNNDAATMARILADDFVLVTGKGKAYNKADLLRAAREKGEIYEHQEDTHQTVRVFGDTAVVTALLWIKGKNKAADYDYKLWFSDTYARTPQGWRYVFGQASTKLAPEDLAQQ